MIKAIKKFKIFPAAIIIWQLLNFFNPSVTYGQELWGYANSNYSGIMGLHLNPAKIIGVPYEWEVNVLAADVFYDNNYVYLPKLTDVATKTSAENNGTNSNSNNVVVYRSGGDKHANVSGLILGPSFIMNKNKYAWAVHSSMRVMASANRIPTALIDAFQTKFDYAPLHSVVFKDMKVHTAGMAVGNIGFTFSKLFMNRNTHWLAYGITVNGLVGFDGAYMHAEVGEYSIPDSNSLALNNVNIDYGHAADASISPKGYGASGDIGLVYIHKRNPGAYECGKDADRRRRYEYKASFAVVDVGFVNFRRNASRYTINNGTVQWNYIDTAKFNGVDDFDRELSAHSSGVTASNGFSLFMPAAASFQFDYCLRPRWYANLGIMQRIPLSDRQVYRANSIALVPRYETRKLEASVSVNMYEYEQVYMGAAFRYLFIVVGSDRLLSFIGDDVRSMDLFFGLKFNSCMLKKKYKNKGACPMNS
jgi:hypothetical protein